jgi:hypothetical protein
MATTVKVEGDDVMQVRIVAAGVVVGLEESGFKNVQTLIELAPDDVDSRINRDRSLDAPATLLASVRARAPELFNEPVTVRIAASQPSSKLEMYATEDGIALTEQDNRPHHQPMQLDAPIHIREDLAHGLTSALAATQQPMKFEPVTTQFGTFPDPRDEEAWADVMMRAFPPPQAGADVTVHVGGKTYKPNPEEVARILQCL